MSDITPNPAELRAVQQSLLRAPVFLESIGLTPSDVWTLSLYERPIGMSPEEHARVWEKAALKHIGEGHYARVFSLPSGAVLKVTDDPDDAQAAELVRRAINKGKKPPGLPYIEHVKKLPDPDRSLGSLDPDGPRSLYAIVVDHVSPLHYAGDRSGLKGWLRWMADVDAWTIADSIRLDPYDRDVPEILRDREMVAKLDQAMQGVKWLRERGFEVTDLHFNNFGETQDGEGVLIDFGDYSSRRSKVPLRVAKNPKIVGNPLPEPNPIHIDNEHGIGQISNNEDIDYFGLRVLMKPSTFHKLTLELPRDEAPSVDWMKGREARFSSEVAEEGPRGFASPMLTVEVPDEWGSSGWESRDLSRPARVTGHEGRNRMYASKEIYGDVDPVETYIVFRRASGRGGLRNYDMGPKWVERLDAGMVSERERIRHGRGVRETVGPLFEAVLNAPTQISWEVVKDVHRKLGWPKVDMDELRMGIEVEQEHGGDVHQAGKVAMDHLREFPDYYTRLTKMEARAKAGLEPNGRRPMPKVQASFNRHFDLAERAFPDLGTIELHEDEVAGSDNGAGSERQFGYCADEKPIRIAFAPKTEKLPQKYIDGLMAHEFGHALDFRYGRKRLERLWGKLPDSIERRADKIAEHAFGRRIEYGDRDIQCIGCGGKKSRPRRLG
jgi:hypothetical protein